MNYYAVLTDHGAQLIEQAYQNGEVVTITQMAIGDGGGVELEPATSALAVAGEFDRVPLTSGASASSMLGGGVDYESQAHVGKWIRTLGLMDAQGNLIVYSNYPPTYIADKGSTLFRTLGLNIQLPIVHGDAVTVIVERPPYPPATYTEQGVTRFATEEEALVGEETEIAVAPKEMAAAINAHYLAAGTPLPTANIGPIWHDDYNDWMTWQTFNQNGANYTGYASRLIGSLLLDTQSTPRAGYIKSGVQNLSRVTYAALRAWAQHNGLMVAPGVWAAGTIQCADNADGTTFRVYDLRGEFLRAWDDGRGVDPGRTAGSWQKGSAVIINDKYEGHLMGIEANNVDNNAAGRESAGLDNGEYSNYNNIRGIYIATPNQAMNDFMHDPRWGGGVARPRNTALMSGIKF